MTTRILNSFVVFIVCSSTVFSAENYLSGNWVTPQDFHGLNLDLCAKNGVANYSASDPLKEIVHIDLEGVTVVDDIYIFALKKGGNIYRKLVLLYRPERDEFIGQMHLYDGFRSFNSYPVLLVPIDASCNVDD
jgi:hypothetical protein